MKLINLVCLLSINTILSCSKFIQVDPPKNLISSPSVYSSDATAIAVMRGIYSQMVNNGSGFSGGGASSVTFKCALSADELNNYASDATFIAFYTNSLTPNNFSPVLWSDPYKFIYNANAVIEGINHSPTITSAVKTELLGEAKFIRAFCYFYLINLFGDVPLITSTDYTKNAISSNATKKQVYSEITADLEDAQNSLSDGYSFSNGERDQPNRWAATALLARVYLFIGDWANAELLSGSIINNTSTFSLNSDLNAVFLANSSEAIWQLKPQGSTYNTNEGSLFILQFAPSYAALSYQLLSSFEPNDKRKLNWTDSIVVNSKTYYFPFKYKIRASTVLSEYSMVLRLSEQFLIRAEARAQQNKISESQNDLNVIRERAGLPPSTVNDKESLLSAILHERQVELFTEWGHRWLDLKRTESIDSVMNMIAPQKGGLWTTNQQLYPIPQSEINNDPNLNQNAGY